jgi:hypothetical protein
MLLDEAVCSEHRIPKHQLAILDRHPLHQQIVV